LVTDDEDLASQFAEETFSVTKDGEKKMKEKVCFLLAQKCCNMVNNYSKMRRRGKLARKQKN